MSKSTGYSLASYGDMITDKPRMEPYVQALRQAVRPGCVVLDLGSGTGIFSLLACQMGAGHVHAVEPDDAIQVAQAMAVANGCAGRITFHQALSTEIALPAAADVIISDLRGVLPLLQQHIPAIADARRRLLAPGGVLIPCRDTLWAALVEDPKLYRRYVEPWLANDYGLNMKAGQLLVANTWRKVNAKPEQLLVPPQTWASLDYGSVEQPDVNGSLAWTVERAGTAHGLVVWFDATLIEDIGFSNAPGLPELIYGQAFFPLLEPVPLAEGDTVNVELRADLTGDDYTWQWQTRVCEQGDAGRAKARFKQSTFFGSSLSPAKLRKREAGHRPVLDRDGQVDRYLLSLMDGQSTLDDIARLAFQQFPDTFAGWQEALTRAGELSVKYGR